MQRHCSWTPGCQYEASLRPAAGTLHGSPTQSPSSDPGLRKGLTVPLRGMWQGEWLGSHTISLLAALAPAKLPNSGEQQEHESQVFPWSR